MYVVKINIEWDNLFGLKYWVMLEFKLINVLYVLNVKKGNVCMYKYNEKKYMLVISILSII